MDAKRDYLVRLAGEQVGFVDIPDDDAFFLQTGADFHYGTASEAEAYPLGDNPTWLNEYHPADFEVLSLVPIPATKWLRGQC